ncbi:hypothetical protein DMTZ50_1368 [Dehalococcoides mccartyi]|uniref:Uncharacterized protein n=1 Tax=Dehalococcoides mccartyi TaxID=61435 RepID=A0A142VBI2_9CHLR|nr:hypothetical protein X794_05570 [Dehalococcoides mccartyi CG5]AMU86971.1 hypothetical protein Dm11a5_1145 [Dehalococcoides mccartyi]AOV99758.1 hypothetical protein DCWBC2_1135 [Dehalococcoides mccartyi]MBA2085539.1 hypothetical protein [Dehalococcoides mccartyi]
MTELFCFGNTIYRFIAKSNFILAFKAIHPKFILAQMRFRPVVF